MQIKQSLPRMDFRQLPENAKQARESQLFLGEANDRVYRRMPFQNGDKSLSGNDRKGPAPRTVPIFKNSSSQSHIAESTQADDDPFRGS